MLENDVEENKCEDQNGEEDDEDDESNEFKWFDDGEWDKTFMVFYNYSGKTIKKGE